MKMIAADGITGNIGSLDMLPDNRIEDGDMAIVKSGTYTYMYRLNANSGETPSLPSIVRPDDTPSSLKRWLLQGLYTKNIKATSLNVSSITSDSDITIDKDIVMSGSVSMTQPISFNAVDEAPFTVVSPTLVSNLNAELFDGKQSTDYLVNISGNESLVYGTNSVLIGLPTSQPNTTYAVYVSILNVTDAVPSIYGHVISERHMDSFAVRFSGVIDSSNYVMQWTIFQDN